MMTQLDDEIEQRLKRLRALTCALEPRARFTDDVMLQIASTPANDVSTAVWRWGRTGIALGALVAAASVLLALGQSSVVEQENALAYGTTEYFE